MDKGVKEVSPVLACEKIRNGALLIDIRETEELEAVTFDMEGQQHIPYSEFLYRFFEIPRDREVILGCNSGTRSRMAAHFLIEQDFDKIFNLTGGIKEWIKLEFPVKRDSYQPENNLQTHKI